MSPTIRFLSATFLILALSPGIRLAAQTFSSYEPPKNIGSPVNSAKNDFAPAISPDGSYMIYNSNRHGKYQDLYITYLKNGTWSQPEPMTKINSPYNDETPFLSADGTILLFSSDRDGSIEMPKDDRNQIRVSFDLYWSKRVNGEWTAPEPLPGNVNTQYHEKTPSLSSDGKTLYYCTWLFGDMNRTALVQAEFRDGGFVNPKPLPAPFNTGYQDLALIPAEDLKGFFFASNRPDSIGMFDIYFVSYRSGKFGTPQNLGEKVNSKENEIFLSRADQRYYICSDRGGGLGQFELYSSFVFTKEANFETRAIHFDFDEAVIRKESYPYLDALSQFLKEHGDTRIEIIGHTDLHGTDDYNNQLSLKRAEAVKNYLAAKGLDAKRFSISGAGKTQPVVNQVGKGFDELNRRTEFRIMKK
ncbi:MAG TPA: OmpA family protein [Spirochaetota bacterium]|nr:OmpA family protein [Spirochaetota bacterium]HPV39669.1 OmpA family protein [Spirochaetota bacterium]